MIAFHATVECKPHKVEAFLQWKRDEAGVQRTAYGFVKSMVLQPAGRPETFFYLSFWNRPDALVQLQQNPAFIEVSRKFGVPLYSPSVRDGVASQTAEDAARHPLVARPVARFRCEPVIDERGSRQQESELAEPYVFHYSARAQPGRAENYIAFKQAEAKLQLDAPGFIKRLLLRRVDDPHVFYYISMWQTSDAAHEFHERFVRSSEYSRTYPLVEFVDPPTFEDCRLIQDIESVTL